MEPGGSHIFFQDEVAAVCQAVGDLFHDVLQGFKVMEAVQRIDQVVTVWLYFNLVEVGSGESQGRSQSARVGLKAGIVEVDADSGLGRTGFEGFDQSGAIPASQLQRGLGRAVELTNDPIAPQQPIDEAFFKISLGDARMV